MMTEKKSHRLIDADALIEWINGIYDCCDIVFPDNDMCEDNADCNSCRWFSTLQAVKTKINNMPTIDAVPVVRCKDCHKRNDYSCPKYWEEFVQVDDGEGYYYTDVIEHDNTDDNCFCAYGERKTDGKEE